MAPPPGGTPRTDLVAVSWWTRAWPALLGVVVVAAVGAPAAVASYRHARDVVAGTGDTVMAPWLPLSVDGMLLAVLAVMWVRRRRGEPVGVGPWAAFIFGMVVTVAANLAAVDLHAETAQATGWSGPHVPVTVPGLTDYIVALFPPLALGIALELVALVARRTAVPAVPAAVTEHVPAGTVPAVVSEHVTEHVPAVVPADVTERVTDDVTEHVPTRPERTRARKGGARTAVPDADVLAWLRDETAAAGTVPGRRAAADRWGVGASRYDRLVAELEAEVPAEVPAEPLLQVAR